MQREAPPTVNFNLDSSLSGSDREGSEVEIQAPLPVATSPFGPQVPVQCQLVARPSSALLALAPSTPPPSSFINLKG